MNVWICKQNVHLEKKVIERFVADGVWKDVVWCDNEVMRPKKNTSINRKKEIISFSEIKKKNERVVAEASIKDIYDYFFMAFRNSRYGGFELDSRSIDDLKNSFHLHLAYTKNKILDRHIDIVIFNRAPHYEGDLILYLAAKSLSIKTLVMQQSLIPGKFFFGFDIESLFKIEESRRLFSQSESDFKISKGSYKKDLFYMRGVQRKKSISAVKRLHEKIGEEYRLSKRVLFGPERLYSILRYLKNKKFKKNLELYAEVPDYKTPYIYFPLHLQPELTTSVFGGRYCDQLLAIEELSSVLPNGWKIYVKENPKQNYMMRGEYFFTRLASIPHVVYVDQGEDTYKLLKRSKAAATITGTVGWESVTGLKPVIAFGKLAWYSELPGVHLFSKKIDLENLCSQEINGYDLECKVRLLTEHMGDGVVYPGYEKMVERYSSDENINKVYNSLRLILGSLS